MALRDRSRLVGFDADAACDRLEEAADGGLLVCAEYTPGDHHLLYVADELEAEYGSASAVEETADRIHEYIDLDFRERELFLDLYPTVEDVEALVTITERRSIVRVLSADEEGLYFSVPNEVPIQPLVDVAVSVIDAG